MIALLKQWWHKPALWYQFWLPQSGLCGGLIGAMLFGIPLSLLYR